MSLLRRILKILALLIIVFIVLTAILAALITFTPFGERWAYIGLLTIVTLLCMMTGYLSGNLFNGRGLIVGLISSFVTVELVILCVQLVYLGEITDVIPDVIYLISVLFGTVGGVVGVNSNK